ncbi:hypothetical protein DFJ73DRAFT_763752 [Zopfochytrium polystomum]|nr:hypothetical protein DFJ73DRAFT_763752 [Zopfochytrium polystomum]
MCGDQRETRPPASAAAAAASEEIPALTGGKPTVGRHVHDAATAADGVGLGPIGDGGDDACLFRALADQLFGDEERHREVRGACLAYMSAHPNAFRRLVFDATSGVGGRGGAGGGDSYDDDKGDAAMAAYLQRHAASADTAPPPGSDIEILAAAGHFRRAVLLYVPGSDEPIRFDPPPLNADDERTGNVAVRLDHGKVGTARGDAKDGLSDGQLPPTPLRLVALRGDGRYRSLRTQNRGEHRRPQCQSQVEDVPAASSSLAAAPQPEAEDSLALLEHDAAFSRVKDRQFSPTPLPRHRQPHRPHRGGNDNSSSRSSKRPPPDHDDVDAALARLLARHDSILTAEHPPSAAAPAPTADDDDDPALSAAAAASSDSDAAAELRDLQLALALSLQPPPPLSSSPPVADAAHHRASGNRAPQRDGTITPARGSRAQRDGPTAAVTAAAAVRFVEPRPPAESGALGPGGGGDEDDDDDDEGSDGDDEGYDEGEALRAAIELSRREEEERAVRVAVAAVAGVVDRAAGPTEDAEEGGGGRAWPGYDAGARGQGGGAGGRWKGKMREVAQ